MANKKLDKDEISHFIDNDLYVPTRTVWIGPTTAEGETDVIMAERAIKNLHILDSKSSDPIEVLMTNPGGCFEAGLAIYDAIQLCKSPITIKVFGYAYSMGAVILQAADTRIMAPNARLMIHYGEDGIPSNHPKIRKKWSKQYDKDGDWMKSVFIEKIREKKPELTDAAMEKLLDFDTILSAEQSVEMGLADKVMEIAVGHKQ
jgi:ATP-dependent Clp endopeptidase proteolytic subunit ClpP